MSTSNWGLEAVTSASSRPPIHLSRWDNAGRLSAHSSVCCDTLLVVHYCLLFCRLKWLPQYLCFLASAGKTLGWCRRKLDRTISIKIWMHNFPPTQFCQCAKVRRLISQSKKPVLISLSHQMGVKISVRSIFMYKINKHFICSLPKCVEGYVINLWCFSKLICYCGFWKIAIFCFNFQT